MFAWSLLVNKDSQSNVTLPSSAARQLFSYYFFCLVIYN